MKKWLAACYVLLSLTTAQGAQAAAKSDFSGFDEFVIATMKDFKVPGVTVAAVKDGQVVLSKGYGLRDVEKQLPVTSKTLFAIGSVTKSFSVTMLGTLVDEGKLDWDRPVRDYYPSFRMQDPVATQEMTMRDLVTHRSGLPRHDAAWYTQEIGRQELIARLRYLEPSKPFRSAYQYNNLMFMTAGYLGGELAGCTWEEAVRRRVLEPLGMHDTNFSVLESQKTSDFSQPYKKNNKTGQVSKIEFYVQDAVGPAGEINSNADDLAKYLLFHLNLGAANGRQLLSRNNALQMQTPQMAIPGKPEFKELGTASYGMAFSVSSYRGHALVEHSGGIDGFITSFKFLPDDKLGVVVIANVDGTPLPHVIARNLLDRMLGLETVDWAKRSLDSEKRALEAEASAERAGYTGQKVGTHPSHDLKDYVGEFSHPAYGHVTVALAANGSDAFELTLNRIKGIPLDHFHYDTFQVPESVKANFSIAKMKISFRTDVKGDIASLSMPLESSVQPIVFTRMAEKRMFETAFLSQFTGSYDAPGGLLTVGVDGSSIYVERSGAPKMTLAPDHGMTFNLTERPGLSVEFKPSSDGKAMEMIYLQPNGAVTVYKRK